MVARATKYALVSLLGVASSCLAGATRSGNASQMMHGGAAPVPELRSIGRAFNLTASGPCGTLHSM